MHPPVMSQADASTSQADACTYCMHYPMMSQANAWSYCMVSAVSVVVVSGIFLLSLLFPSMAGACQCGDIHNTSFFCSISMGPIS